MALRVALPRPRSDGGEGQRLFLGRTWETLATLDALQARGRLPVLIGNSGVGKSSIAQAGVLAALRRQAWPEKARASEAWPAAFQKSRQWCFLTLKPGESPRHSHLQSMKRPNCIPPPKSLVAYAALLAPEPIPLFLFREARLQFGEPLASQLVDDGLDEAVAALRAFALIDRETIADERDPEITTETMRLHRLVRTVAARRLRGEGAEEARGVLIEAMARAIRATYTVTRARGRVRAGSTHSRLIWSGAGCRRTARK